MMARAFLSVVQLAVDIVNKVAKTLFVPYHVTLLSQLTSSEPGIRCLLRSEHRSCYYKL